MPNANKILTLINSLSVEQLANFKDLGSILSQALDEIAARITID